LKCIIKDLIEYYGIEDNLPDLLDNCKFSDIIINNDLSLPDGRMEIKKIVRVSAAISIVGSRIEKNKMAVSIEGQVLTGKRLLVEGLVYLKIEYIDNSGYDTIQVECFSIPFANYIAMPAGFVIGTPIDVKAYIQDILVKCIEKRKVYSSINLVLVAK
jgi:hypothetical protein